MLPCYYQEEENSSLLPFEGEGLLCTAEVKVGILASHMFYSDTVTRVVSLPPGDCKSSVCMRSPMTLPQWGGEGACWLGEEVPVLHWSPVTPTERGRSCYWSTGMKVPDSYLALFDTTVVMVLKLLKLLITVI